MYFLLFFAWLSIFLVYTVLHFPYTLVSLKVTNVHRCFRKKKHLMHADILCCLYIRLALNDKYLTIVTKRVFYATASFAVQVRWQPRWLYNDYEGVFFCLFVFLLFFLDLFSLRGYPHAKTMRKKRLDITPWRIFFHYYIVSARKPLRFSWDCSLRVFLKSRRRDLCFFILLFID